MEPNTFYGITFPENYQLNTETQRQLAFLLLASSTTPLEARNFIENTKLVSKVKLLIDNLQCEIVAVTTSEADSEINTSHTLAEKLLAWREVFSMPNPEEIDSLCLELKVPRSEFDDVFRKKRAYLLKTPVEISEFLSESVIGQIDACQTMGVVISNFKKRLQNNAISPIYPLFVGPTGTGKGLLCENLAELTHSIEVNIDCSSIVPEGIVGNTISKQIRAAYKSNHFSEKYVIIFDETCKLSTKLHSDDDKPTIQNELLRFCNTKKIPFFEGAEHHGTENQFHLDPKFIQCVFSGAFHGLDSIVYNRLKGEFNGNSRLIDNEAIMSYVLPEDLQNFGIIPELSSRLTYVTHLKSLGVKSIYDIMTKSTNSELKKRVLALKEEGVKVNFSDGAIWAIAEHVHAQNVGVRPIVTFVNQLFKDIDLNPLKYKNVDITEKYVNYYLIKNKYRTLFNQFLVPKPDLLKIADNLSVTVDFVLDNYMIYKQFNK